MSDLNWPAIILAGWFVVSVGLFARQVWGIWRPKVELNPEPIGIQILHRAVDEANHRHVSGQVPLFCPSDTPNDVFAAASNHLDRRRRP